MCAPSGSPLQILAPLFPVLPGHISKCFMLKLRPKNLCPGCSKEAAAKSDLGKKQTEFPDLCRQDKKQEGGQEVTSPKHPCICGGILGSSPGLVAQGGLITAVPGKGHPMVKDKRRKGVFCWGFCGCVTAGPSSQLCARVAGGSQHSVPGLAWLNWGKFLFSLCAFSCSQK